VRKSIRTQLTVWYLAFFTILLAGFSVFLYALLSRSLYQRLDATLTSTADTAASFFQGEVSEANGDARAAAAETLRELRIRDVSIAISDGRSWLAWGGKPECALTPAPAGRSLTTLADCGPHGARVLMAPVQAAGRPYFLAVAAPLDPINEQLHALLSLFLIALPLAILAAGIGGFLLAGRSTAPLVAMAQQAEAIGAKNLDRRLEIGAVENEVGRLARVFNELLGRLDNSFASMKAFMADASHELRTPLAVIRGEVDVALERSRAAEDYRESLAIVQDEARRLSRLVDDLLNLARADGGTRPLDLEDLYLNDLIESCCQAMRPLANRKGVSLAADCPAGVAFRGDPQLLGRMISNLLDNAIRYTPEGGEVRIALEPGQSRARIVVADTGIGIPAECAARVFERFYRVDKSRSRAEGGFGLGLAIVKWIAEAHQGAVTLVSQPGRGSVFSVELPLQRRSLTAEALKHS
jgi:two-component system OmpR family sensor kinase